MSPLTASLQSWMWIEFLIWKFALKNHQSCSVWTTLVLASDVMAGQSDFIFDAAGSDWEIIVWPNPWDGRDNNVLFVFNPTAANDKCIVLFWSEGPRTRGLAWPGVSPVQRQSSSVSWRSVMAETGGSQSVTQSLWSIMSFLLKDASLSNYHKGISLHNI